MDTFLSSHLSIALGARPDLYRGFMNIGPSMDYLERAFDDAKYGWYSEHPYIDCAIQSTIDPDMAPPGKHVLSCFIQYTPYKLRESDWDSVIAVHLRLWIPARDGDA